VAASAAFDFAQAQRFDDVDAAAVLAPLQTDFIADTQCVGKKSRAFEVDTRTFDDTRVSIEGITEQSPLLDRRSTTWCRSALSCRQHAEQHQHRSEYVCVMVELSCAKEETDLLR